MQRVVIVRRLGSRSREQWARGYRWAASRPGWITRLAVLAFLLVVVLPIALLVMLAAIVVFVGLALLHGAAARLRGLFSRAGGEGRENVRVIRRDGPGP